MSEIYTCGLLAAISILLSMSSKLVSDIDAGFRRSNDSAIAAENEKRIEWMKQLNHKELKDE